ncbi:MAG: hypothetical protein KA154_05755 [Gemmatimonadaceae bacterium]|nr:hypothetical protein [Gemmatimonadaceae bacterium]MCC6241582.1 hypothetical protein [Gemmatimonadaceae bacterium]
MTPRFAAPTLALALGAALTASPLTAQDKIKVREVPAPVAISTDSLGMRVSVRALSDGRVLVNDIQRFRVLLYDKTLKTFTRALDSSGTSGTLGNSGVSIPSAHLIAMPADSTMYLDIASRSLLTIDPAGKVAHVTALPRPQDILTLSVGYIYGTPTLDAKGRLVYQGTPPNQNKALIELNQKIMTERSATAPAAIDSAPIVRADFDTRKIDTIATVKIVQQYAGVLATRDERGNLTQRLTVNPTQTADEWGLLPDGTIAILRAHDYHMEWVAPDGTRKTSPKMAFDWKRLTDEGKQHVIDSIKPLLDKQMESMKPQQIPTPDGPRQLKTEIVLVSAKELPDYEPVIQPGAMKIDLEGNIWIVPRTAIPSANGGLRYDVVNREGVIVERVIVPKGRAIAAFEPGGWAILTNTQGTMPALWTTIERVKIR